MAEFPNITAGPSPYPASGQNGAIGGGVLRPGSIDQTQFQELLQAQYRAQNQAKAPDGPTGMTLSDYRKLAGTPAATMAAPVTSPGPQATPQPTPQAAPGPAPAARPSDGIPTLSLEQFAALTGLSAPETPPSPPPVASDADGLVVRLTTSPVETAEATPFDMSGDVPVEGAEETSDWGTADGVPVMPPSDPETGESETADEASAQPVNPRTVLLTSYPDRDQQRTLAAQGKHWRMKETPGARELFLGPDGKFGWDDFVDIINPLQHIPVVAQVYRAVTGDQAYGLSAFLGAAPFGPLSVASAILDTVIRDQTGRDAGTDMAARILGIDNRTPEEANLHLVRDRNDQLAAAESAPTQVAYASPTAPLADSPATRPAATTAWTREGSTTARD